MINQKLHDLQKCLPGSKLKLIPEQEIDDFEQKQIYNFNLDYKLSSDKKISKVLKSKRYLEKLFITRANQKNKIKKDAFNNLNTILNAQEIMKEVDDDFDKIASNNLDYIEYKKYMNFLKSIRQNPFALCYVARNLHLSDPTWNFQGARGTTNIYYIFEDPGLSCFPTQIDEETGISNTKFEYKIFKTAVFDKQICYQNSIFAFNFKIISQ